MRHSAFLLLTATIIALLLVASFSCGLKPAVYAQTNSTNWQLSVYGLVENPLNLTLADLEALPQTTEYATLYCVDPPTEAIAEGNWTGVQLWTLLETAGVSPNATKVAFFASDGFTTDLPIATAQKSDIIVAYAENGIPLSNVLRLVVPGEWGYKWIDLLTTIQLVNYNFLGTEESLGYDDNGVATSTVEAPAPPADNPSDNNPPSSTPSVSPYPTQTSTPTPYFSATPPPTLAPPAQTSQQTPQTTNYIVIALIAILIATAAAAVTLRKTKQTKNKKQVQSAPPN